ncbi:MAG TPA: serine hydrolase domain-containing protein [Thermomonospora sp.]|nr:serine hydrolase domain-containing protein [Thermomonospora sp.]
MTTAGAEASLTRVLRPAGGATAVAVGVVRDGVPAVRCRGSVSRDRRIVADARTRFEIGSVTKTFTALLLAEMAAAGLVDCDDPVNRYLPADARLPGPPVTLLHLATHTSGLPRLPRRLLVKGMFQWFSNPYARFGTADLLAGLPRTAPRSMPGTRVHYSNLGVALLGYALGRAAGDGYESALQARVLDPLGLSDTDGDPRAPQATGYWHRRPRPPWRIPGMPGAGMLRSSGEDLLRYVTALLDPSAVTGSLGAALRDVQRPRPVGPGVPPRCLVWNLRHEATHDLVYHGGATRGFTSFVGFSPQTGTGLVALTNTTPWLRNTFIQSAYDALRALAAQSTSASPSRS